VDAEVEGDVRFPDLIGVPVTADLQHLSVMMCDPRRPATIVPGRGNHRRWEFMLLPGEDDEAIMRPEVVAALVAPWLEGVQHRITRAATYRFHGLIAKRWRVGRVFLAGDAAHQTPPFFGQGMCHGLRDVANLAWKLAMVASGDAAPGIMDSYQPERDPHVRAVISAAVSAGRYICMLDPDAAAARDAEMRAAARDAGPTTAADLIPAIEVGIVLKGTAGAGERFIQPWIDRDGQRVLLDTAIGCGWRLFAVDTPTAQEAELHRSPMMVVDASTLGDGGAIAAWLTARSARAVIVRPDFYVFGTGNDAGELIARRAALLSGAPARAEEPA
jgi:3-(3-hydroxy-phenyl)propionate hydroxylase